MSTIPIRVDDCWNRIGVSGDQSCEKLEQHVHCRNCEVYSSAAQRNLQRPVGDGYRENMVRNPIHIDAAHIRAIIQEIGERLRLSFKEVQELPAHLKDRVKRLQGRQKPRD